MSGANMSEHGRRMRERCVANTPPLALLGWRSAIHSLNGDYSNSLLEWRFTP